MINPQRSIATETAKFTSEINALEVEIAALNARAEPVRERANSLGRLYDRCVEFLGGNGDDR